MTVDMETRPPTRPLTTTEEIARSLERIAYEMALMNRTLDRIAVVLGAGPGSVVEDDRKPGHAPAR